MGKNTEIELKAHADNPDASRAALERLAGPGQTFSKDDSYWFLPGNSGPGLRIRRENSTETASITCKIKECRNGLEVNTEHEFEVSGVRCFEELLIQLGLKKRTCKHKEGMAWNTGGICAELCRVKGSAEPAGPVKDLGWFLELEISAAPELRENPEDRAAVEEAEKRLLELLEKTGISKEKIESCYYSELLTV